MRRYRKWVLTLGIVAVTPGIGMAGLFGNSKAPKKLGQASPVAVQNNNQQVAEQIADALRRAKLSGYDIEIEYNNGVAVLAGKISDPRQKAKATKLVSRVRGVQRVDNRLTLLSQPNASPAAAHARSRVREATFQRNGPALSPYQQAAPAQLRQGNPNRLKPVLQGTRRPNNQKTAEKIAKALSAGKLNGYDIEISYKNGQAMLSGSVSNQLQRRQATHVVQSVPGVQAVVNHLTVSGQAAPRQPGRQANPYAQTAFQGQPNGASPAGYPPAPGYGHPGRGASHTVYNMPNLPGNSAWPSYASYPNYAQVNYPKQYSASAWPYIGPFYPYPQVPMGWREAQLEWDDGSWHLNFRPRTSRWWWFLSPKNW